MNDFYKSLMKFASEVTGAIETMRLRVAVCEDESDPNHFKFSDKLRAVKQSFVELEKQASAMHALSVTESRVIAYMAENEKKLSERIHQLETEKVCSIRIEKRLNGEIEQLKSDLHATQTRLAQLGDIAQRRLEIIDELRPQRDELFERLANSERNSNRVIASLNDNEKKLSDQIVQLKADLAAAKQPAIENKIDYRNVFKRLLPKTTEILGELPANLYHSGETHFETLFLMLIDFAKKEISEKEAIKIVLGEAIGRNEQLGKL